MTKARKKLGQVAFDKKAVRREKPTRSKCRICGTTPRPKNMNANGICLRCEEGITHV